MRIILLLSLFLGAFPLDSWACTWDIEVIDDNSHEVRHFVPGAEPFLLPLPKLKPLSSCRVRPLIRSSKGNNSAEAVGITCSMIAVNKDYLATTNGVSSVNGEPVGIAMSVRGSLEEAEKGYTISITCN